MTAKLEYDEETGQVKGWIIDENAGKEAMLGQRKRGTWKFFKAADLGMAARGPKTTSEVQSYTQRLVLLLS